MVELDIVNVGHAIVLEELGKVWVVLVVPLAQQIPDKARADDVAVERSGRAFTYGSVGTTSPEKHHTLGLCIWIGPVHSNT